MTLALALVALTLLAPWGAAPAARRLAALLPPREASVALTGAAVLLAGGTAAALVALFHVPFLASMERVPPARVLERWPAVVPVSGAAGVVLAVQAVLLARRWLAHRALLAKAWASTGDGVADGDVLVVPGGDAEAFALPGFRGRPGRVVVTSGMVRELGPAEREVLLAHERAHLAGRHHVLSVVTDLAAAVHPALRGLREALGFHLERWADEAAAGSVGDRRLAATAIARAALAGSAATRAGGSRNPLLSVGAGPVPRRVEALLGSVPVLPRGRAMRVGVAWLVAVVAVSVLVPVLAYGLHEYVEYAARAVSGR
ncbi:M56 family metallopeptidase [Kitasatospora sp. NPDC005751]|uniref:M56 family metallopeptidase n=1 Tax=Kitasatospora sp. NPDC005751 TaxID=3157064 RepID=UPI0033EA40FC